MPDNNTSSSSSAVNNSNHEGSDFSQCFKKVDLIGKQLDKINKRLTNEELQSLDEADLSVRLDYIESLNASFEGSISTLEEAHGDNLDESIRSNFMSSYFEVKAKLKRKIDGSNHARICPQSSTFRQFSMEEPRTIRKTRLPELKIPAFNGSYTDWPNFFSMFTTVIDNDLDLTNIEKFQHLRSLLVGAALDTISSLEPIDSNYNKALELLKNRFDNKLLLFQSHIKDIFGLKIADKGSAVSLRQLSDKLNAHVRALETVCTKEQLADGLLINIVVSKLDHQTQTKWEEGLQNDKLPTWNSMASFLERRSRMLENLESSMKSTASNQHSNKKPPMHGRNVLIASGSKSVFCTYCKTDDHYISSCSRFTNLHPTLRFKEVKRLNLCLNCLRKGHRLQKCKFGPCRTCHMKHHSLLHIENNLGSQTTTSQIDNMPPQQPTTSQLSPPLSQPNQVTSQSSLVSLNPSPSNIEFNDGSNILLATAIVLVKNKYGNFVPCRAILDSASQLNFMTTRFVNQAQLNMKNANIAISGIGEGNITADKTTEVLIKSCHSDYCVSFVSVIIPSITEYQPNRDIDVSTFEIPNNIKLADANFYERGRIDLLIGAGLFFDLMSVGQIRCKNKSTIFQKTRLGWVVSGGCVSKSNGCSLAASSKGLSKSETQSLAHIMKSFWEVEQNYGNNSHPNSDDAYCEQHFIKNTIRLPSGEYSVSLPRKLNFNELGDSYSCALRRFLNLERKLNKLPAVKKKYVDFMNSTVQIHAFCDASLSAYGVCIYIRSEYKGEVRVSLLCSKSRVAPLKVLTVPKLELSAALLLAEILDEVSGVIGNKYECHCWSDSMVVLSWLRDESSNYNVFVSNRVSRIQTLTQTMSWHHVPTAQNPADILSRGSSPEELVNCELWKNGPAFLNKSVEHWPKITNFISDLPERRRAALISSTMRDFAMTCKFHNSFHKIQRIFAYVFRFINIVKLKSSTNLTDYELKMGTKILFRNIQLVNFAAEYKALKSNKNVPPSSKLYSLAPFMDSDGLIRVGGRLQNSYLNFDAQHPIIVPKQHPLTASMVMYYHEKLLHAGPQCLLANIRQQYWPLGGRKTISIIASKCIKCFRLKPKITEHVMGSLPHDRVQPSRAFFVTGIDFCGPFYYKSGIRNRSPLKCYICIFICFSTKATHMEVVADLSTSSFLASLRRFISIRGKPKTIWSDNATNFVGAKNELKELRQLFFEQNNIKEIEKQCLADEINWKFIPPRSPHFGGLWEAAVKSAKYHFYRTVGQTVLTFDELRTLACEICAVLNSRPLCQISEDPNDLEVLTPGHFLVGAPLITFSEPDVTDLNVCRLTRWQRVCYMQQIFWKKWSSSYLALLQERTKWISNQKNISIGNMVLIKEDNLPPLKWLLGRVVDVVSGGDGVVRVALIKTLNGIIRRSVTKLALLPIDDNFVAMHSIPTGGGCSGQPIVQADETQ